MRADLWLSSTSDEDNLTNKAMGTIWRDLSKPPQRREDPDPRPLWLLVGTPWILGPELFSRRAEHSLLWRMSLYILIYCFYHLTCLCNNLYGLSALVGCWSSASIRRIIYIFINGYPFDYTAFKVSGKVGVPLTGITTQIEWMYVCSVAIFIDRPQSVPQLLYNRTLLCSKLLN